ncbi:hypothetical protein ACH5RR_008578 [Cinchona calisaya]|uniref:non-specific serine/threonine protein kinase n=1 Tax=Cinchona calisaya TaxID=153742 RepID=A0ABD3AE94_9GENT
MPHQILLFLLFFPFFISFFFNKSNGTNSTSLSAYCYSSKCGDLEVKYPFWIQNNITAIQYCDYQGFGLECLPSSISGKQNLILHLPNDDFYVKNISYTNYTLTLVDIDVTTNLTCPRARHNFTLEGLPLLDYSMQDLNLTFYFNCTNFVPSLTSAYALDCLRSGGNSSYVSLETNTTNFDWLKVCEDKVVATVFEREINGMNNIWASMFAYAMNDGFVLDWHTGIDCAKCELSEGHCGYNNNTKDFLCFCSDGTIKYDQCKGELEEFRSNGSFSLKGMLNEGPDLEYNIDSTDCVACVSSDGLSSSGPSGTNSTSPTCLCIDGTGHFVCASDRAYKNGGRMIMLDVTFFRGRG